MWVQVIAYLTLASFITLVINIALAFATERALKPMADANEKAFSVMTKRIDELREDIHVVEIRAENNKADIKVLEAKDEWGAVQRGRMSEQKPRNDETGDPVEGGG